MARSSEGCGLAPLFCALSLILAACGDGGVTPPPPPDTTYTVAVRAEGSGTGTIRSTPSGIDCEVDEGATSGSCSAEFEEGTSVTLEAIPDSASGIARWSGDCTGEERECSLNVTADHHVTASLVRESLVDVIDSEGGEVRHPEGATIVIPSGSVDEPVEVSIDLVSLSSRRPNAVSPSFDIELRLQSAGATNALQTRMSTTRSRATANGASSNSGRFFVELDVTADDAALQRPALEVIPGANPDVSLYPVETEIIETAGSTIVKAEINGLEHFTSANLTALDLSSVGCENEYELLQAPEDNGDPGVPVVYIHGWQLSLTTCSEWQSEFDPLSNGREVFGHLEQFRETDLLLKTEFWQYTYPSFNRIDAAGERLAAALAREFPDEKVILIGHSMGGLVARAAAELHTDQLVSSDVAILRVITLGTPHLGAELADLSALMPFAHTQGVEDMRPNSSFITTLNDDIDTGSLENSFPLSGRIKLSDWGLCDVVDATMCFLRDEVDKPLQCGHDWDLCAGLLTGAHLLGGESSPDGIVRQASALGSGVLQNGISEPGETYDHFELRKGNYDPSSKTFPCEAVCDDPILLEVARLVADALPGPATDIVPIDGTDQIAVAGEQLPEPVQFKVIDEEERSVSYESVRFTVPTANGDISTATAVTDLDGVVSTTLSVSEAASIGEAVTVNATFDRDDGSTVAGTVDFGVRRPVLLFTRIDETTGVFETVLVDWLDQTSQTITDPGVYNWSYATSPDGSRVAMSRWNAETQLWELWMHEWKSGTSFRIYDGSADNMHGLVPSWSPDGKLIAFEIIGDLSDPFRGTTCPDERVRVGLFDLSDQNLLTTDLLPTVDCAFTPEFADSQTLVTAELSPERLDLWAHDLADGAATRITATAGVAEAEAARITGTRVIFTCTEPEPDTEGLERDICSQNVDGSERTQITSSPELESRPTVSRTGEFVAFEFSSNIPATSRADAVPWDIVTAPISGGTYSQVPGVGAADETTAEFGLIGWDPDGVAVDIVPSMSAMKFDVEPQLKPIIPASPIGGGN